MSPGLAAAEGIIFAVDLDPEVAQEATKGWSTVIEVLKQCIVFFATAKKKVNANHMFGLATLADRAVLVQPGLTSSVSELSALAAQHLQPSTVPLPTADLGSLSTLLQDIKLTHAMPPRLRVVLLYCRSRSAPAWTSNVTAGVPLDVVYVHEKPQPGVNQVQEVYNLLEEQADAMAQLAGYSAYIFETSSPNIKKLLNLMVLLLAHPNSRVPQQKLPSGPLDLATLPLMTTSSSTSSAIPRGSSGSGATPENRSSSGVPPDMPRLQRAPSAGAQQQLLTPASWPTADGPAAAAATAVAAAPAGAYPAVPDERAQQTTINVIVHEIAAPP